MITFCSKATIVMILALSALGSTAPVDLHELESQIIPEGRGVSQKIVHRDPLKFGGYPDQKPPGRDAEEPRVTRKEVPIQVDGEPIVKAETHPEYQWSLGGGGGGGNTPLPYPSEKAQEGLVPTLPPSSPTTTTGQPDTSSSSEEDEIPFTILCSKYGQIPGLPLYPSLGGFGFQSPDPTLLPKMAPTQTVTPPTAGATGSSFSENMQGIANELVKGFIRKQIHDHTPTDPPTVAPPSVQQTFKGDGSISDWNIQGVASDLVKGFVKKQIHDAIGRVRRSVPENLDGASEFFPERKTVGIDSVNPKQVSKRSTKNLRKRRQIYPQLPTNLPNPSPYIYAPQRNQDNPPYNPYYRPGDFIYQGSQSTGNPLYQENIMGNLSRIYPWLYRTTPKPTTTTTMPSILSWFGPYHTTTTTTTTTTPKPTTTTQSSIFSWFSGAKTTTTTKKPMGWLNPRTGIVSTRPTTTTTTAPTTTTTRPPALSISNGDSIGWAKHPRGYKPTPTTSEAEKVKKDKSVFGMLPWMILQKLAMLG